MFNCSMPLLLLYYFAIETRSNNGNTGRRLFVEEVEATLRVFAWQNDGEQLALASLEY